LTVVCSVLKFESYMMIADLEVLIYFV